MFVNSVSVENYVCRVSMDTNIAAVRNTLQGSKARDRVAFLMPWMSLTKMMNESDVRINDEYKLVAFIVHL